MRCHARCVLPWEEKGRQEMEKGNRGRERRERESKQCVGMLVGRKVGVQWGWGWGRQAWKEVSERKFTIPRHFSCFHAYSTKRSIGYKRVGQTEC